jgi:hypothetical protein
LQRRNKGEEDGAEIFVERNRGLEKRREVVFVSCEIIESIMRR